MKNGTSNTTNGPSDSTTSKSVGPEAMTWVNTWELMNRTFQGTQGTLTRMKEELSNPGKPSRNQRILRTIQMDASTHG